MDTCLVRKRVRTDDRLGRRHGNARDGLDHATGAVDLRRINAAGDAENIRARFERHNAFLHGSVARALSNAVDCAFDLVDARFHAGQRICDRHTQIVVHVAGEYNIFNARRMLAQVADPRRILLWNHISDRIRNINRGRSCLDCGFKHAAQEIQIRAAGVLCGELDIVAVFFRIGNIVRNRFHHFVRRHFKLILHMHRRGGQKRMDAGVLCAADGIPRRIDVLFVAACQRTDR